MKRITGFLGLSIILCSMAFTASSHPPTEKQVLTEHPTVISEMNVSLTNVVAIENTFNADILVLKVTAVHDLVQPVMLSPEPLKMDYKRNFEPVAYIQPGKIKTKYHSPWLFDPVKLC